MTAGVPETTSLAPIDSRALEGQIGHLTAQQEAALKEFKEQLAAKGYAVDDEVALVRFLRARKFDPAGAFAQYTSAEDWRRLERIDELYDNFPLDEFEQARRLYPQWTGRRDKAGLPVYVFKVGALKNSDTDAYVKAGQQRLEQRMVALYEHMVQFVLPFCSSLPREHNETPISGCATIVDISNVSLRRFWQLREHMQRASVLASARYAETLGSIYLIGAPSFFSTVWGWVKRWFDPGTVEKIHILPSSPSAIHTILTTHIPPSSIPRAYGGELDWDFGAPGPALDDDARAKIGGGELPEGPVRWDSNGGRVRVVGQGRAGKDELAQEANEAPATKLAAAKEETFVTPPTSPSQEVTKASLSQKLEETRL
ncbi:hypothetical protein JCM8097_009009 [Rhodosporidiobolus ruineniae]